MSTNNHQIINGYDVPPLNNDNSGFSKWGFATKYGKEYFIKELTVCKVPGFRLKTALTSIAAAANEKAYSDSLSVSNIAFFNCSVIHTPPHSSLMVKSFPSVERQSFSLRNLPV